MVKDAAPGPGGAPEPKPADIVAFYHERTKHHLHRYATGPDQLDWATQPDPFRRYRGAPLVRLPLPEPGDPRLYEELYAPAGGTPAELLTPATVSRFLRYSLSLTAWKEFRGTRWALRANPSSGNLHPTEGYLVLPAVPGLSERPGVHHYAPREHALELRADLAAGTYGRCVAALPAPAFLVGLTSIHWREAWKYGERAYRYCQHDVGHALAALRLSVAALGWRARLVHPTRDDRIAALLGIDRAADYPAGAEREAPDLLLAVGSEPRAQDAIAAELTGDALRAAALGAAWHGSANALSSDHRHDWPAIELVATAAADRGDEASSSIPVSEENFAQFPDAADLFPAGASAGTATAEKVILGRRSAVAMDGLTAIDAATFYRMLARLVPVAGNAAPPWDALPWRPRIHLALFVHRVNGLAPGLYALARDPEKMDLLRAAMRADFAFAVPPGTPAGLPLRRLTGGDLRDAAATISCHQTIASGGAFSLGMLAEMRDGIAIHGPSFYRRLYWEAGMIGQVLYLEAEAAGVRATGIGCYFDDAMHHILGLEDDRLQSFYHFTTGGPVEDERLTTLPAYGDRGD